MSPAEPRVGQYEPLLETINEQRERIAFFEPVVFHAHSIDSHDWAQRLNADVQRNDAMRLRTDAGVDEFLDELARHYRVVCITDHMRCTYAARLARAALKRDDITVLPGMEINCLPAPHYADAIHVLAVFPPEAGEVAIERIFAGKSLAEPEERSGKEAVRFDDLRELRARISEAGGLFVLAHLENEKRGHRARFRLDRAKTLALYTEGAQLELDLADEYGIYLAKLRPDAVELQRVEHQHHYARFTADGEDHQVACVASADHHSFEDYEKAETATRLKVARCDFESVREALRFHETRVRLPGQVTDHTAPRLIGLRLNSPSSKGLFADTTIAFSPNLNCLIGPRGSGKSTVIEALRYVLGRNAQLAERAGREVKSFADLAQRTQAANLRDTRLELVYERCDGNRTVLSATFDETEGMNTRTFTPEGEDLRIGGEALINDFPVAIFSWSELEVLGREPGPQRDLVDRLLPGVRSLAADGDAVREQLAMNRSEITDLVAQLARARAANGGRLGRYRQFREAYDAVNTPEAAALFAGLDTARQRKELIKAVAGEVEMVGEAAQALGEVSVFEVVAATVALAGETTRDWWASGPGAMLNLVELDARVKAASDDVAAGARERSEALAALAEYAEADTQSVEQELRSETRLDDAQDLLRDQRELARERFELVEAEREQYLALVERLETALAARDGLIGNLAAAQDALSAARQVGLAPLNEQLSEVGGDRLQITVARDHLADRAGVIEFLNNSVLSIERAGQYMRMEIAERLVKMARPAELSAALVAGKTKRLGVAYAVGSEGALNATEAKKLVEGCVWRKADEDAEVDVVEDAVGVLLELAEQPLDDRVRIRLNGKPVDQLSPGQRSSAMLPLIALAETDPLVIDQPEDNLDNAMVGDTLTRILVDLKDRRQIILSTHNPNIVVGGDAEQVVVLDAPAADRAEVTRTGSIDDEAIIEAVLTIMEGGREAFIARRKRYRVE
jgi:ABC-type cobalamin/Fe3+-siderophores transport system ATPase subunit